MVGRPSPWTDEEKARLRALWPDHSASEIGRKLGRSKNAVCAQVDRMGLPVKGSPIKHSSTPAVKPESTRAEVIRMALAAPPEGDDELEPIEPPEPPDTGCLWPQEPCEAPRLRGKPYCEAHCRLAYRSIDSAGKVRRWVPGEER